MAENRCSRSDCEKTAHWYPVLLIRPKGFPPDSPAARGEMRNLALCGEHAQHLTAEDLISDEGWAIIENAFVSCGRAVPDRATVQLEVKRL